MKDRPTPPTPNEPPSPESVAAKCPGIALAGQLDPRFQELIATYHHRVWGGGAIPLKYKYLMALATAVTMRQQQRAMLEAHKAVAYGATDAEIRETLELAVWLGGSPLLVEVVGPVLRFVAARREADGRHTARPPAPDARARP